MVNDFRQLLKTTAKVAFFPALNTDLPNAKVADLSLWLANRLTA